MGLKDRLLSFIEYKGFEKASFERICNLSNGFVDKAGENTRKSSLDRISNIFPDLNMSWLRTGEGKMIKSAGGGGNTNIQGVFGNNNTAIVGVSESNVGYGSNDTIVSLRARIKELEEENKQLRMDKAILHEHITMLREKK